MEKYKICFRSLVGSNPDGDGGMDGIRKGVEVMEVASHPATEALPASR